MSALGQEQTSSGLAQITALTLKSDIDRWRQEVCFVPKTGKAIVLASSLATRRLLLRVAGQIPPPHSITSSARARTDGGTPRPSALAVLRLIARSYLIGACTGKSAGFSPLRMRST